MTRTWIVGLLLLTGCPKGGSKAPKDPAADLLNGWARQQLDLRSWRSCARAAVDVDLENAEVVFPIDATGKVGTVTVEPNSMAHDPAMICLQMELAHPPENVPNEGDSREIRFRAGALHEVPGPQG